MIETLEDIHLKKKLLLLVLFLSVLIYFLIPTAAAASDSIQIESIDRTVNINYNKIVRVTDQYVYLNTGNDPITSLIIEVPYIYTPNVASFEVFGADNIQLSFDQLPYDGSGFIKWRIYLNTPLRGGNTYTILNRIIFTGITPNTGSSPIDGKYGHINFNFVKYPSAPYYIKDCSVTLTCDQSMTIYNPDQGNYVRTLILAEGISLSKNNVTQYNNRYNLSEPVGANPGQSSIKFPQITRELTIDLWGYIYVWEQHLVEHDGPYGNLRVKSFVFNVPLDAENFYIYDKFGRLAFGIQEGTTKNVTIDLDATRYTLRFGENTYYWMTYRIPLANYMQRSGDKVKLNIDVLFGQHHCLVEKYDISIVLPKGTSLNYVLPSVDSISFKGDSIVLTINETDVTEYNSRVIEFEMNVSKSYIYFLTRPLLFLIILGTVCSGYVVTKRIIPGKEGIAQRTTVAPAPIVLEFCSLFEEKVSLISELEKLDDDLKKRKIKKRIYRNQRKTAERKIIELDKDINDLKIPLKEAGGRFAQIVNELEINEAERESAKDGIFNLEQRYIRKKISTVAYQKLLRDLITRHKKASTKIDKLIFELREILT